ncbi:MAG: hypothetical protein H0T76_23210 [Nannocystis sp.]|nr:hypothetical protein [Nannocystis sp.]MBA3549394.1 hypothetical protein [Nannocystis sp.]
MKAWFDLYQQHTTLRHMNDREAANEVRQVFVRHSEEHYALFKRNASARLLEARDPRTSVTYTLTRDRAGEALTLDTLPEPTRRAVALKHARLTVLLRFDRKRDHLQELAVMLTGIRHDDTPLEFAVHLPHDLEEGKHPNGDRDGLGACGHAALHCHVAPTLDTEPKVRVPLPPLRPAQIVEWVLSQVVPTGEFEPAPWLERPRKI